MKTTNQQVIRMFHDMEQNPFVSAEELREAKESLDQPHTTYTVRTERQCCYNVNLNRHDVESLTKVRDGKVVSTTCSWCGKPIPAVSERDLVVNGSYDTVGVHSLNGRLFWAGYGDSFYLAD